MSSIDVGSLLPINFLGPICKAGCMDYAADVMYLEDVRL